MTVSSWARRSHAWLSGLQIELSRLRLRLWLTRHCLENMNRSWGPHGGGISTWSYKVSLDMSTWCRLRRRSMLNWWRALLRKVAPVTHGVPGWVLIWGAVVGSGGLAVGVVVS